MYSLLTPFYHIFVSKLNPSNFSHSIKILYSISQSASAVCSSVKFLSKRYWWSIIMSVLVALWMIANIIYYRANELFINTDAMAMVDNMDGFWSSIWLYVNWECVVIFVISILYVLFILKCYNKFII